MPVETPVHRSPRRKPPSGFSSTWSTPASEENSQDHHDCSDRSCRWSWNALTAETQ
jgi:hypothetical protein